MTLTRIYDPARVPAHWTELILPGQFAVFIYDARTRVARDAEGGWLNAPSLALCGDLTEAVSFAMDVVARQPDLCCEIYDHEGKSKDPLRVIYNPAVRGKYHGLGYAKRETLWGSITLLLGITFIVTDARRDLAWIWGYVIGVKLTLVGGSFLVRGLVGLYEHRAPGQISTL